MLIPKVRGLVKEAYIKNEFIALHVDIGNKLVWIKLYEPRWLEPDKIIENTRMIFLDCDFETVCKNEKELVVFTCYDAERLEPI